MVLRLALLALAAIATSTDDPKPAPPKPAPPKPAPVCAHWSGTVSGNDPSVAIAGTLCEDDQGRVTGTLSWSSERSGSNVRSVSGSWSADHGALTLHDGAIVESHPNPGWRFCVVDEYDLTGSKDSLAGKYHSSGCNDHAAMTLTRSP